MEFRTYLCVPSADKRAAEALGAIWDPGVRKLYVPEGMDEGPFQAWRPMHLLRIDGPLFVAESEITCKHCQERTPVIALVMEVLDQPGEPHICNLYEIKELSSNLARVLGIRYPFFRTDTSHVARLTYMMNHCRCGAQVEDWDLHDHLDGGFFPTSPEAAATIVLRRIPRSRSLVFDAGYSFSTEDLVGPYAARRSF